MLAALRHPPRQDIIALQDVSLDACCERKEPEVEIGGRRIADPIKICIDVRREGAEGKENASHEVMNGIPSPLIALMVLMHNLKPQGCRPVCGRSRAIAARTACPLCRTAARRCQQPPPNPPCPDHPAHAGTLSHRCPVTNMQGGAQWLSSMLNFSMW